MFNLHNKIALVTGASSGIGYATAKVFAKSGAKLLVTARRQSELDILVSEINDAGGEAFALSGDVREEDFAQYLVTAVTKRYGGLDIAFNNAGIIGTIAATSDLPRSDWQETLDTNLTSAYLGAKYQIPEMIKRGAGSLIFTASFVGYTVGMPEMAAYSASKAGLIGLTKSLATELGSHGIRVNALVPGGTNTPMAEKFATTPETLEFVNGLHILRRIASAEEIAKSALYLASDDSSFTTGSALVVDGGVSINRT